MRQVHSSASCLLLLLLLASRSHLFHEYPLPSLLLMDPDTQIQYEYFPFIRQYKSGRVERLFPVEDVPASVDPRTGVACKDVVIDANSRVAARLYFPNLADTPGGKKLPVVVYYHGGGFVIGSPFKPASHNFLNILVAQAGVIAVSVDYRLAPEHPLPVAYDDSWAALKWVASHAKGGQEPWLKEHGDLERIFVMGCSAGGNIAHHMALRAGAEGLLPEARIEGMVLIDPYFWGKDALELEALDEELRAKFDGLWFFVCPATKGLDDPVINPVAKDAPSLKGLGCERALVTVAEKDELRERGKAYCEGVRESGWGGELELVESEGEGHAFLFHKSNCEKAKELTARFVRFLNGD